MSTVLLYPSHTAHWYALVNDAEHVSSLELGEELESYLVFLLMRFVERPEIASSILAIDFLQNFALTGERRQLYLRDVGDKCLLFSGLFPEIAKRRRVNLSYYIDLGQSAYALISDDYSRNTVLFENLSQHFECLINVLACMRKISNNTTINSQFQTFITQNRIN